MNNGATIPKKMLEAAAGRQDKIAEAGIRRSMKGSGERVAQIDPVLFHQGIKQGRRLGVKEAIPWDNPDFCREMSKCHPEIGEPGGGGGTTATQKMIDDARELVSR